MNVTVGNRTLRLTPRKLIGQGGEAEVFTAGKGRVVKIFKQPDHPDFAGDPALRSAAAARLDEHQHKLPAFPLSLPSCVVTPDEMACDSSGAIVGYSMEKVDGTALYELGRPKKRRAMGEGAITGVLDEIREAVVGLHKAGVVIGDFNDLNILEASGHARLIDADSFQFDRFRCHVYSERFLDPRLLAVAGQGGLDYNHETDWFAFAVMVVRSLLSVGPYGGVHQPTKSGSRVPATRRALERLSIFDDSIKLPRASSSPDVLPDELRAYLEAVFAQDLRDPFPARLLELRWRDCQVCGLRHARRQCPHCSPKAASRPPSQLFGATPITDPVRLSAIRGRPTSLPDFWIEDRRLLRRGTLGPEHVGDVLSSGTRFWVGESFGLGFYNAGRLRFGFVFDRHRRGLNDQVELEPLRATIASADCKLSAERAWLSIIEQVGPRLEHRLTVVGRDGKRIAHTDATGQAWAAGLEGACALGPVLLVPTDDGVVRLETDGQKIVVGKTFSQTSAVVHAGTTLVRGERQLYAITDRAVFELSC